MTPDLLVSRTIKATATAVYESITDITRMGEWSPECYKAEWNEGFNQALVGAVFTGYTRNGAKEGSIESTVVELVENERFFFDCIVRGFVFAKWGYAIEPTDSGCVVTEYWQDLRPESSLKRSAEVSGVTDRASHNRDGMEKTLERVANAVE